MKRGFNLTVCNWRWWLVLPLAIFFMPVGLVGLLLQRLPSWIEGVSEGYESAFYPIRRMFNSLALWAFRTRAKPTPPEREEVP